MNEDYKDGLILAKITIASELSKIAAKHKFEERELKLIGPRGYYYIPAVGENVMISSIEEPYILGCVFSDGVKINPGEILIKNDSGAYIKLLNNGEVEINKLIIDKEGKIRVKDSR